LIEMDSSRRTGIIDARTDEQWLRSVNNFVEREHWNDLWKLAQKTPPIWTVRIVKLLKKKEWSPGSDEQPGYFERLCEFAGACNEFDLPGPDIPVAKTRELGAGRVIAARATSDGEFLFAMDEKATALDVYGISDGTSIERIRLDMF